jgi:hypothetical protein
VTSIHVDNDPRKLATITVMPTIMATATARPATATPALASRWVRLRTA